MLLLGLIEQIGRWMAGGPAIALAPAVRAVPPLLGDLAGLARLRRDYPSGARALFVLLKYK
jgi:hypothetical protein